MLGIPALVATLLVSLYAISWFRSLRKNIKEAKASGLPYVVQPVYLLNRAWLVSCRTIIPILNKLPKSFTETWLPLLDPEWFWIAHFDPFTRLGKDIFLTVSPGGTMAHVANAEAVWQIVQRRTDFPKPTQNYALLEVYGRNVVSTEGPVWRQHRKITSPPFTEKNNAMVWGETLYQAQRMLDGWVANDGYAEDVQADTQRLPLHVISRAGFGVRLAWPGQEGETDAQDGALPNTYVPEGHTMSYQDALNTLLHNILAVLLIPKWILRNFPSERLRKTHEAYVEWGKHMNDLYENKKEEVLQGEEKGGVDLMGALVRGAGITSSAPQTPLSSKPVLTDEEILGNVFVFILAGHETTANNMLFSILSHALHPSSQRRMQSDLDAIFGDRPVSEWDYETDTTKLFGSMVGATMNESLRLWPPAVSVPKSTKTKQTLVVDGQTVTIPAGAFVSVNTVATHRNPRYWGAKGEADVNAWRPERWIEGATTNGHANGHANASIGDEGKSDNEHSDKDADLATEFSGSPAGAHTSPTLYRPVRGSFIPFSEGFRACLGRRFAQVEIVAVLAVIFKSFSVELDVREWASDDEVDRMSSEEKRAVWEKARKRAEWLMNDGTGTIITLQIRQGKVPIRVVQRGRERFAFE